MSFIVSDTFVTSNGPTNGAIVYGFKASRFSSVPTINTPFPSVFDAGPVTTSSAYGGPGAFQLPLPTDEQYYLSFTFNGQTTYQLYNSPHFIDGTQGSLSANSTLYGNYQQGKQFIAGSDPNDLAIVSQIVPGPSGAQGAPGIYIGATPPPETDILWADTTDPSVFSNNGLFFNPVDYGADPTGVHDSTQAIQTCLFLGHTELPAGLYSVTNLYFPDGASLTGRQDFRSGVYGTNPLTSTVTSVSQIAGTTGPLITINPTVINTSIKNIYFQGSNTTDPSNYAVDLPDSPGSSAFTGTTLTASASQGSTSITVASIAQVWKAATLLVGSAHEVVVVSTSWDGVSTTIPLVSPLKQNHSSGNAVISTGEGISGGADCRMENVAMFYFSGDYTVYWGDHRYGNKMEHCAIYGAGHVTGSPSGGQQQGTYVAGSAYNSNGVGMYCSASDCGIHASEIGASASHNLVVSCQPFGVTECDIWSAGKAGQGNGIRIKAGSTTSRIYIGSRTEFDSCANEAIYIEGNGTSFPAGDVQIGPGCFFSGNCQSEATGGTTLTNPRANIAVASNFRGMVTVMGNTAFGATPGGVDYNLNVQEDGTYSTISHQNNRLINTNDNTGYAISEVWQGYSINGTNTAPITRYATHVGNGMVDYIKHKGANANALLYYLTGGSSYVMYTADSANNRADLYTNAIKFGTTSSPGSVIFGNNGGTPYVAPSLTIGTSGGNANITSGTGAPSGSGNKGDIYFRTDTPTTANQRIYIYTGSTWTGIV